MTNKEVLERANPKEIEQMLGYLLMEYWEQLKDKLDLKDYGMSPINTVSVYKNFLKQETYVDTELYDMMYPKKDNEKTIEVVLDAEYVEIDERDV